MHQLSQERVWEVGGDTAPEPERTGFESQLCGLSASDSPSSFSFCSWKMQYHAPGRGGEGGSGHPRCSVLAALCWLHSCPCGCPFVSLTPEGAGKHGDSCPSVCLLHPGSLRDGRGERKLPVNLSFLHASYPIPGTIPEIGNWPRMRMHGRERRPTLLCGLSPGLPETPCACPTSWSKVPCLYQPGIHSFIHHSFIHNKQLSITKQL